MKTYYESVEINHNLNWPYIPDDRYEILIIGGSGSGKTNVLLNLSNINDQMFTKFICTSKIHSNQSFNYLSTEEKKLGMNKFKKFRTNLEGYNPINKRNMARVFDDMRADMEANKKLSPIITELFMGGKISTFQLLLCHNLISKCLVM